MAKVLARLSRPYHEIAAKSWGRDGAVWPWQNKRRWPRAVSPNGEQGETGGRRDFGEWRRFWPAKQGETGEDKILVNGEGFGPPNRARQAGDKILVNGEGFGPPVPPLP
ncbi:MAG: hypothetical protein IT327_23020 [Anaerolineae bacterium]|nr:hypothetical protein [Anaerolineae bacterium]